MNGNNLLLDTNIVLYLLNGDKTLAQILTGHDIYISFITELELLGYQGLNLAEITIIKSFISNCIVIDINQSIKTITIQLKQKYNIKLPDAIIAATSNYINIPLISADKGFERISELQFIKYEL